MPRYSESRVKYPKTIEFKGTEEHERRIDAIAAYLVRAGVTKKASRWAANRFAIDHTYISLNLSNSIDQTDQPE